MTAVSKTVRFEMLSDIFFRRLVFDSCLNITFGPSWHKKSISHNFAAFCGSQVLQPFKQSIRCLELHVWGISRFDGAIKLELVDYHESGVGEIVLSPVKRHRKVNIKLVDYFVPKVLAREPSEGNQHSRGVDRRTFVEYRGTANRH